MNECGGADRVIGAQYAFTSICTSVYVWWKEKGVKEAELSQGPIVC